MNDRKNRVLRPPSNNMFGRKIFLRKKKLRDLKFNIIS